MYVKLTLLQVLIDYATILYTCVLSVYSLLLMYHGQLPQPNKKNWQRQQTVGEED